MKRIIFILISLLPSLVYSQEPISFSEVVEVSGVDKNELFIRGREWFNENFKSSKDVFQINDKETGELVGKGFFSADCTYKLMGRKVSMPAGVYFQISIWVKEAKYKYELKNFNIPGSNDPYTLIFNLGPITTSDETETKIPGVTEKKMNEVYLSVKKSALSKSQLLIESLKTKMANKSKSIDW